MRVHVRCGKKQLLRQNFQIAKRIYPGLTALDLSPLRELSLCFRVSVAKGEVVQINGNWYITHAGLLSLALRRRCRGIKTSLVNGFSDSVANRWVFKANVYTAGSKCFVGYGDADPSNVSPLVRGAEMRVAETRAVNRALRKAYGIGLCSVEELGSFSSSSPSPFPRSEPSKSNSNGSHSCVDHGTSNGQYRLRDRLCLQIRQHHLDASLVKSYAAEYCGTQALREASREMVEAFIAHLGEWASRDREGLEEKLQSYVQPKPEEVSA